MDIINVNNNGIPQPLIDLDLNDELNSVNPITNSSIDKKKDSNL